MTAAPVTAEAAVAEYDWLCHTIAGRYYAPGLERDDLDQEARLGLLAAVRDFRGERGGFRTFAALAIERRVITAVRAATRQKHRHLNEAVSLDVPVRDHEDAGTLHEVVASLAPSLDEQLAQRDRLAEAARVIRERLTDLECACLVGHLNDLDYVQIAEAHGLTPKVVDRALQRARWKLAGKGPPSAPGWGKSRRRRGEGTGYRCPSCACPTTKRPGRGRPPRCNVCRMSRHE